MIVPQEAFEFDFFIESTPHEAIHDIKLPIISGEYPTGTALHNHIKANIPRQTLDRMVALSQSLDGTYVDSIIGVEFTL